MKYFVCILLCISCGKLDEMGERTERAAQAATESREEIANGRLLTRSGNTSKSRRDALQSMFKQESFDNKVTEASKFFKAFEFQLLTGQRYDTEALKDRLYDDAINEFFRALSEANGGDSFLYSNPTPFKIPRFRKKYANYDLNILALSVSMHGVHNFQDAFAIKNKVSDISVYDILKMSLKSIKEVENGLRSFSSLKKYEESVYNKKNEALGIIATRVNMLLVMGMMKLSDLKESKIKSFSLILGMKKKFQSKFESLNKGEKNKVIVYLDAAKKAKAFLDEYGYNFKYDKSVNTFYTNLVNSNIVEALDSDQDNVKFRDDYKKNLDILFGN